MSQHYQPSTGTFLQTQQPQQQPTRNRITIEGRALIEEAISLLRGREPTLQERKVLLERLKKLPGCEFYKLVNLNVWFQRNSPSKERAAAPWVYATTASAPAPRRLNEAKNKYRTLTPSMCSQLARLLELESPRIPLPSAKVRLWADMLAVSGANPVEVERWVEDHCGHTRHPRKDNDKQSEGQSSKGQLPPTPVGTATPEPERPHHAAPRSPGSSTKPVYAYAGTHAYYLTGEEKMRRRSDASQASEAPLRVALPSQVAPGPAFSTAARLPLSPITPLFKKTTNTDTTLSMTSGPSASSTSSGTTTLSAQPMHSPSASHSTGYYHNFKMHAPMSSTVAITQSKPLPSLQALIARGIAEHERSSPQPSVNLPTTAEAFNAHWASYEVMVSKLERSLDG